MIPPMPLLSLGPRDRVFFDLFKEAGGNALRTARLLQEMLNTWPDDRGLAREILLAEQEGDRITHDIVQRVNSTFVTPIDGEDIYALATQLDDIVDDIEEVADFLGLYKIEAPMEQAQAMADVLVKSCEELDEALSHLRGFKGLEPRWIEVHRLENEGDRVARKAIADLFAKGGDTLEIIKWKEIYALLESAIDKCEDVANIIERIVIKQA
jgi:predicted phosphate transport protein (TIGR00153 family)